ncbi:crotonase/enoyl-CoA hydratase family protein [Nocardia sp. NPDC004711]
MTDEVLTEFRDDGVTIVTINRPRARNAINRSVSEGLAAALDELDRRDDQVVGIITGAGGTFSSGMDLKAFLAGESPAIEGRGLGGITEALPRKPVIAAVEGYALAGGCELALACDMIVAAQDSQFGIPEVKRGLVAAGGGLLRLPQRIPYSVAMEIALTGDFLDATRAHSYGLVNRLAEPGQALDEAVSLAHSIAVNGPLAVRVSKQVLIEAQTWPVGETWERMREATHHVFISADAQEGPRAFAEKREPRWTGR